MRRLPETKYMKEWWEADITYPFQGEGNMHKQTYTHTYTHAHASKSHTIAPHDILC